jgi:hypothetical protein
MVVAGDERFEDPPVPTDDGDRVAGAQRKSVQLHARLSSLQQPTPQSVSKDRP